MSNALTRVATTIVRELGRSLLRGALSGRGRPASSGQQSPTRSTPNAAPHGASGHGPGPASAYPGDYCGPISSQYKPNPDGNADPGEIVWAWIPYEEDPTQGKDRPALVIGADGRWLLALQVTSQDHDRDAEQEARAGRYWMDIGTGAWDQRRRPSEVRLNRVIRLDPATVRREGAALERATFDRVISGVNRYR